MPVRICIHTKTNGTQCGSPAMRGDLRCYYHYRQRRPLRRLVGLNNISTPAGRQEALAIVIRSLHSGTLDHDAAEKILRSIAMAMKEK